MGNKKFSWLAIIFGLFLVVRIGLNVVRLWKAGNEVEVAKTQLEDAKAENSELKEKLAEVKTPYYMEREARSKLGYGREGEVVLVIPPEQYSEAAGVQTENKLANWEKWRKLYLGF